MAVLTLQTDAPGKGAKRPLKALGARQTLLAIYTFDFDSSYPTGGEDISTIWTSDGFAEVLGVFVQMPSYTAATGKEARVDLSTRKILLFDNAAAPAQVANASDQSTITGVRLFVFGR